MIRFKTSRKLAEDHARSQKRLLEAEELIHPRFPDRTSREIAVSLSAVVDEGLWRATPIHDSHKSRERMLLLELVQPIFVADFARRMFGGPVKSVSTKQLRAVRFQAKQLASAARDLPPDVQWTLLNSVKFRPPSPSAFWTASRLADVEEDFLPRLDRLSEAAGQWGKRRGFGLTARQLKTTIENELAFTLALHGVDLNRNREGLLANVLRVGWQHLGLRAGADPYRTLVRLTAKWNPSAVKLEAQRREAEAAVEAANLKASPVAAFAFAPVKIARLSRVGRAQSAGRNGPKSQ